MKTLSPEAVELLKAKLEANSDRDACGIRHLSWDAVKIIETTVEKVLMEPGLPKYSEEWWEAFHPPFRYICEALDVTYYAAPREDFSMWSARDKIKEEGRRFLYAEDLS